MHDRASKLLKCTEIDTIRSLHWLQYFVARVKPVKKLTPVIPERSYLGHLRKTLPNPE